jgi:hypothetical protein
VGHLGIQLSIESALLSQDEVPGAYVAQTIGSVLEVDN